MGGCVKKNKNAVWIAVTGTFEVAYSEFDQCAEHRALCVGGATSEY